MGNVENMIWKKGGTVYTKITDPIERRDAIAVVENWFRKAKLNGDICIDGLKTLPPAQPNEEFEWCCDCKEYDQTAHCCHRWTKAIRKTVEELEKTWPKQPEIIRCRDCKHYYFADNRIPQEQRYVCDIGGEIWQPDDFCSYGERREVNE